MRLPWPPEVGEIEKERGKLYNVSLSSAIHHLELISEKYLGVMTQPWGFSFAEKSKQEIDVKDINDYIKDWNENKETPQIHQIFGKKIQYTAPKSGIIYSTHDDSNQLYPISGPGVYCGNGAVDMYYILKSLGKADSVRVIQLYEAAIHSETKEYKEASKAKIEGGHRSGVTVPKAKTTSAANIAKMKPYKLTPLLETCKKYFENGNKSGQFSLGQ